MSKWIKLADQKPKNGLYIVCDAKGSRYVGEWDCHYDIFIVEAGEWIGSIEYWRPLPDAPVLTREKN